MTRFKVHSTCLEFACRSGAEQTLQLLFWRSLIALFVERQIYLLPRLASE